MIYGQGNPYCYTEPITDPGHFVGRAAQLARCQEIIVKRGCLSLVGGPRSGLTSLLKRLSASDVVGSRAPSGAALRMLYVDCRPLPDPRDFLAWLLQQLAPGSNIPPNRPWQALFGSLIRTMDTLRVNGEQVVLLLDDFEAMGGNQAYVEFLDRLRGLTIHAQMSLITTTHTQLKSCCHMSVVESPFPNMFSVDYLGALDDEEAQELIALSSRAGGVDLRTYSGDLLALSGRMPYLLQMACWRLYQAKAEGQELDQDSLAAFLLQEASPVFAAIWQGLSEEEQELMRGTETSPATARRTELVDKGYMGEGGVCSSALATFVAQIS